MKQLLYTASPYSGARKLDYGETQRKPLIGDKRWGDDYVHGTVVVRQSRPDWIEFKVSDGFIFYGPLKGARTHQTSMTTILSTNP